MKATKKEIREAQKERAYWRRIGKIIGSKLHGWSYYSSAGFVDPYADIPGFLAEVLLGQQKRIKELEAKLDET